MINVGAFKHIIVIFKPLWDEATRDEYGRETLPWARVAQVRAAVADVSGREYYEAAAHQLQNTVTFTTRWLDGISTEMRILFRGDTYQIDQVNHLRHKRDFIRLRAHAIQPEGNNHYGEI